MASTWAVALLLRALRALLSLLATWQQQTHGFVSLAARMVHFVVATKQQEQVCWQQQKQHRVRLDSDSVCVHTSARNCSSRPRSSGEDSSLHTSAMPCSFASSACVQQQQDTEVGMC
jgi:hypothetical protein